MGGQNHFHIFHKSVSGTAITIPRSKSGFTPISPLYEKFVLYCAILPRETYAL